MIACSGCVHDHEAFNSYRCSHCSGGELYAPRKPKDTPESRMQDIHDFAESTPFDPAAVMAAFDSMDACAKAIEYNEYLKRRRRRDKIEKFLGFQRRILQWVFNAQKIKRAKV